jgi:hypothetical protein
MSTSPVHVTCAMKNELRKQNETRAIEILVDDVKSRRSEIEDHENDAHCNISVCAFVQ